MQLDRYDQKLVSLLVEDARRPITDLSKLVSLSRSAVTERIKRLEDRDIITGYHAVINSGNKAITAYVELTFHPKSCNIVQPYVEKIPEVQLAHSISGDVDLILLVEVSSMDRLNEIRSAIEEWPNLDSVVTHICLSTRLKRKNL
ncbi:Lrp/AsnC family transcriptional regulator [Marinomonas sp. 2405UD68-3]|uniref:Lrp/AsnC family transcriptional regulator n=1 Tax=Marinomonas sp. 2405UD68-3 TaxID=3391835 RepID=UPI0039C8FEFD